jgi:tetratricopeptide (TPR) repeat protein
MQSAARTADRDDLPRAVEVSQRILRDHPKDLDALMGLLAAYERLGDAEALFAEIEHALFLFEGEQCLAVLLRKASALAKFGEREQSSELRANLLEQPDLPPSVVESILAATYEDEQFDVYRKALELQVESEDAAIRMRALERLGDFHLEQRGDGPAAIESWKPAARLYAEESSEDNHGRELYERVLEVSPNDDESALELIALYAKSGDWAHVPEVYGALLRSGAGIEAAIKTLLDVEAAAARAGAVDEYVSMVDETIPHLSVRDDDSHRQLLRTKARMLSADPQRTREASASHRQVLESFGSADDVEAYAAFIKSRSSRDRRADLRWLFEFRANRAADPVSVLVEWARFEEGHEDLEGAILVHQRILERAPGDPVALEAIARLRRSAGDFEGYLGALRALRDVAEPRSAAVLDLRMAAVLVDVLGRPVEGVLVIERWLSGARLSGELLGIVGRALAQAETRARVIEVVVRATSGAGPEESAEILGVLVGAAGSDREIPESSRSAWYARLIELHSNDADSALALAARGVRDMPDARPLWEALVRLARQGNRAARAAEAYRGALSDGMASETADAVGGLVIGLLDESAADTEEILGMLELILDRVPRARWALDRATLVLSARGRWDELFALYGRAIEAAASDDERVELLNEAAVAARDLAREPERAITFLEAIHVLRPSAVSVQSALERLYERGGKIEKLAHLLSLRARLVTGGARLELLHRLAAARLDLGHVDPAAEALAEMLEHGASMDDVKDILERMLNTCAGELPTAAKAPAVAERAASLLSAHYTACGLIAERRELRGRIASMLADRSSESERAVHAFEELFADDAGDAVAESCAERFSALLASTGRTGEQAELWERIGHCRLAGANARAADAWSTAASLWEDLEEPARAVAAHSAAAALGSDVAIAALGRLHAARGRWLDAAQALEWLVQRLTGQRRLECGVALANAYTKAGEAQIARSRLADLVELAAVALDMEPQSKAIRLQLGEVLDAAGRHDESVTALRGGLSAGGEGPSKQDAPLHRAIAVALLHAGRRKEALAELEVAARLNPTEPGTLHALGRVAFDEGNLELAETTLRGLVLFLRHGAPAGGEGPSRAEVYLDLSRIAELRGDPVRARDLAESAFDSALESPEETARLERILEDRGRHDLLALVLERRMRSGAGAEKTAQALDALVTLWEGPLGRATDTAAVIARHAELVAREAVATRNVTRSVWAAHVRACAAVGGEAARVDGVKRHLGELARAAEALDGDEKTSMLLETARQYHSGLGQLDQAAAIAEALFEKNPTRADVWLLLRDLYRHLGNFDRLVDLAETVLWSTRSSAVEKQLRLDLARALLESPGKVELAIATFREILEDDPNDAAARDALVDVLEREGRHEELAGVLLAGLDLVDPAGRRVTAMRLGRALERASRSAEATLVYVRLAEDGDVSVKDLRVVAARLEALGSEHLPDCLEQLCRRETGASAVALAHRLVELRAAKHDRPGMIRALELGFALKPEEPRFRDRLLRTLEEEGRSDEVLDVLGRALQRDPSDADLLRQRAWLYEATGRLDDAIVDLEKAVAVDPSLADDLVAVLAEAAPGDGGRRSLELFDLLLALDRASDARSVVEVLLERIPKHVGGLERLASLAAAEGDSALARRLYRELLPLLDEKPSASLLLRAAECMLDDDPLRALELSEASRAADPLRADGVIVRARAQAKLGRLGEAEATLRELSKLPRSPGTELVSSVHLELAHLYLSRDDLAEAFDCLKRAFSANPNDDEASLLLGLVAIDLDDDRTALRALRAASTSRSAPESKAVALHQLACLARRAGDAKKLR